MMFLSFLGGLVLLVGGAELLVRGGASLARRLGLSTLAISLTVVAYGTSLPELAASIEAGHEGAPGVAIGNVLGSNVANVLLVLGLTALVRPIPMERNLRRQIPAMLAICALLPLLLIDGVIARWEGVALACGAVAYTLTQLFRARGGGTSAALADDVPDPVPVPQAAAFTVVGTALLPLGAWLFVTGAVAAARALGVAEEVVGLTLVAFATSVPELITCLVGAIRKVDDVAVGNVVGSNVFNVLAVLGVAAACWPLAGQLGDYAVDIGVMLGAGFLLWAALLTSGRIGRRWGAVMVALYVAYIGEIVAGRVVGA